MSQLKLADGREYSLLIDYEAMIAAESVYGKPLPKLTADLAAGYVGAVRAMVYGALTAKHPDITPAAATAMLDTDAEAVGTALALAVDAFSAARQPAKETASPTTDETPAKPKRRAKATA